MKFTANTVDFLTENNSTEQAIIEELQNNGPLVAAFMVYKDFFSYKTGVYFVNIHRHLE